MRTTVTRRTIASQVPRVLAQRLVRDLRRTAATPRRRASHDNECPTALLEQGDPQRIALVCDSEPDR